MNASTSHRSSRQAGAAARRPARSRTIKPCPCSNTPAKSATTSSKRWCVAARHQSARRATATSFSDACPCLPRTLPAAQMEAHRNRSAHAERAAIPAAPAPARSIEIANKSRARRPRCLRLRPPEISLRSHTFDNDESSAQFECPLSRHAPTQLIRSSRIARNELAAMNRFDRFQASLVGGLRRSAGCPARPRL